MRSLPGQHAYLLVLGCCQVDLEQGRSQGPQAHRVQVMCQGAPQAPQVPQDPLGLGKNLGRLVPRVLGRSLGRRGLGWLAVAAAAAAVGDAGDPTALLCLMLLRAHLRTAGSMGQGAPHVPGDVSHEEECLLLYAANCYQALLIGSAFYGEGWCHVGHVGK
jgi:hypothetical protein